MRIYEAAHAVNALKNHSIFTGSEVVLHVYDLHSVTKRMNIATFHLGIEVFSQEIFFSRDGILSCKPAGHQRHIHKQALILGRITLRPMEVKAILEEMGRKDWTANSYNILGCNCQTFAVAFAELLGLGDNCIPQEFRRQSDLGAGWRESVPNIGGLSSFVLNRMLASTGSASVSIPVANTWSSGRVEKAVSCN
jgi:hypothetical protein